MQPGSQGDQIAEQPEQMGNPLGGATRLAEEGRQQTFAQNAERQTTKPIGMAEMSAEGTISLHLHSHGGLVANAEMIYTRGDKNYRDILNHLGGLRPGEVKLVQPWTDQIRRQDISPPAGDQTVPAPTPKLAPTADFTRRVTDTYNGLPQNVRDALAKDGVTLVATDKVTDVMPQLKGQKPRGWPPGSSWHDVDGAYDTTGKRIIVAERQGAAKSSSNNVEGLTRHETGHAVDDLRDFSDAAAYVSAYDAEVPNVPATDKQALDYFLQKDEAGRQEMFAENFAILHGGATTSHRESLIKKNFPTTMNVVKDQTSRL